MQWNHPSAARRLVPAALAAALALLPVASRAQVPPELGYQGRLLNADGTPAAGIKQITFSLYGAATGGTALWSETLKVPLTRGFYAVLLGKKTPFPAGLFNGQVLYLEIAVGTETLTPRQEVGSVAYAMMADAARNQKGGTVDASKISVGGKTVIDGTGKLTGPAAYIAGTDLTLSGNTFNVQRATRVYVQHAHCTTAGAIVTQATCQTVQCNTRYLNRHWSCSGTLCIAGIQTCNNTPAGYLVK